MQAPAIKFKTVDQYISTYPKDVQVRLAEIRAIIKKAAPKAEEVISYNMPAFKLNGVLVYFAANKAHIGFYPLPSAIEAFKKELAGYETSKGTIQFPYENKLPVGLIRDIVKFRVEENKEKEKLKKK